MGRTISDILPIARSSETLHLKGSYKDLCEEPVLQASQYLFTKGIQTTSSSAHYNNAEREGYGNIEISYDTLSDKNRSIVDKMVKEGVCELNEHAGKNYAQLKVSMTPDSSVDEVSLGFMRLAEKLEYQRPTWTESGIFSFKQLVEMVGSEEDAVKTIDSSDGYLFLGNDSMVYPGREIYEMLKSR
jgi:hypothetical protein